jgi:hypothetical protein
MRFKLAFVLGFLTIAIVTAFAQGKDCKTPPCFCVEPKKAMVQPTGGCEENIEKHYKDLLSIANTNWNNLFPHFQPPPSFYSEPGGTYGRCEAENTKAKNTEAETTKAEEMKHENTKDSIPQLRRDTINVAEPLPIETGTIRLDENQQGSAALREFVDHEATDLAYLGQLVGRLEIRYQLPAKKTDPSYLPAKKTDTPDCTKDPCQKVSDDHLGPAKYAQWGTAIQIADDAILTSCHQLESLVEKDANGNWHLKPMEKSEALRVDFGERDDQFDPCNEYKISELLWLPDEEGFDVAVLKIEPDNHCSKHRHFALPKVGNRVDKREIAVIGYPDFHHPLDPCAEATFEPYKLQGDAKFVSLGCAEDVSKMDVCATNDKGTFLHTATTTMGESGSIVIDRENRTVIGLHVCCSYPQDNTYGEAPESQLKCANLKRTQDNQAISLCKLLSDSSKDSKGRKFKDVVRNSWLHCAVD